MTPPEKKAYELVQRYNVLQTFIDGFGYENAKECALIFVDETVKNSTHLLSGPELFFWDEVKKEIDKR